MEREQWYNGKSPGVGEIKTVSRRTVSSTAPIHSMSCTLVPALPRRGSVMMGKSFIWSICILICRMGELDLMGTWLLPSFKIVRSSFVSTWNSYHLGFSSIEKRPEDILKPKIYVSSSPLINADWALIFCIKNFRILCNTEYTGTLEIYIKWEKTP